MDPITTGALVAAINAASGDAGQRALDALSRLARRVVRRGDDPEPIAIPRDDEARLRELVARMVRRADQDEEFRRALAAWLDRHGVAGQSVHNEVSGDARVTGPVIQGRDFHGPISFGPTP